MSRTLRYTKPQKNDNQSLIISVESAKSHARNIAKLTLIARAGSGSGKHQDRRMKRSGDRTDNWKREQEISS